MVVLRCIGPSNFFLERVLFPTDILTFMAPNDSRVEIWENSYMVLNWRKELEFHLIIKIQLWLLKKS